MSPLFSPLRFKFFIPLALIAVLVVRQGIAQQPLVIGELNVAVRGIDSSNVQINVTADAVFGSRTGWYQKVFVWDSYTDYGTFRGQHIDRYGGPDTDTIGYAKYFIGVNDQEIYVDFRDADYETAAYTDCDIWLKFSLGQNKFYQIIGGDTIWTNNGSGVGIWDNGRKSSGSPRIPVTIQNSYPEGNGGTLKADGTNQNSPFQTVWATGNHSVEAYMMLAGKNGDYYFSTWSDGGDRYHTVNATVAKFAKVLTAYFTGPGAQAMDLTQTNPPRAYPNPFNPSTTISYDMPERSYVSLTIVNTLGQQVAELVNGEVEAGHHDVKFNGQTLASGAYYCLLKKEARIQVLRLLLVK